MTLLNNLINDCINTKTFVIIEFEGFGYTQRNKHTGKDNKIVLKVN